MNNTEHAPQNQESSGPQHRNPTIAVSLVIGIAIGVAIGVAMDNIGAGVAIGVGLGLALSQWRRPGRTADADQRSTPPGS